MQLSEDKSVEKAVCILCNCGGGRKSRTIREVQLHN